MARTVVFGAGGHARVVIDALVATGCELPYAALDRETATWGNDLLGVPVRGDDSLLPTLIQEGVDRFVVGVGSIGKAVLREKLFENGLRHDLLPLAVRHPTAVLSRFAECAEGVQLLAGCIVNAHAFLDHNVIINTGAIVEHDCKLAAHVHVAPGARLSGGVVVGQRALIGVGATVKQQIKIGVDAVVGAGAVVIRDVPPGAVVAGVPATIIRRSAA